MSICRLIASDKPLPEFAPSREKPVKIDIDSGTIEDGGGDDNFSLLAFDRVKDYTGKEYGVYLEWNYTAGRAEQIIAYIKTALQETECIEFWKVWLMDYWEFEDRPFIHRKTIPIQDLTPDHIQEIHDAAIWNTPDKRYPERPSFYCLTVTKQAPKTSSRSMYDGT